MKMERLRNLKGNLLEVTLQEEQFALLHKTKKIKKSVSAFLQISSWAVMKMKCTFQSTHFILVGLNLPRLWRLRRRHPLPSVASLHTGALWAGGTEDEDLAHSLKNQNPLEIYYSCTVT